MQSTTAMNTGGTGMERAMPLGEIRVGTFAWSQVIGAGGLAGLAGGLLMATGALLHGLWSGAGASFVARLVGASFVGPVSLAAGAGAVLYGFALHILVSMAFGVLFAMVIDRSTRPGPALLGGVLMAMAALALMTFVVVPAVNPTLHARVPLAAGPWFFAHVLYGIGLALAPSLLRRRSSRTY